MLATFGRVLARTTGLNPTTKTLPVYKTVISLNQFLPTTTRALATATAPKKAGTTTTKKTTTTTASRAKAPTKKTTITTSTTKKAPAKTAATKKASATATSRKTIEAPKREKKKPLSDDEKLKLQVKTLLEKALDPPNIHANASTWVEFLKTKFAAAKGNGVPGNILLTSNSAQWVSEYKALSPAQVETLKAKAEASKESSRAKLVKWVRSHTPAEIHEANLARIQIRKLQSNHDPAPRGIRSSSFPAIPDDRYPRGPRTANIFYALDKLAGVPVEQRMSVVPEAMKGFATLPVAEQNKYKELAAKDLIRYHNELRTVGIQPSA